MSRLKLSSHRLPFFPFLPYSRHHPAICTDYMPQACCITQQGWTLVYYIVQSPTMAALDCNPRMQLCCLKNNLGHRGVFFEEKGCHRAEVVGIMQVIARHVGCHILLAPHVYQFFHIPLQLIRLLRVNNRALREPHTPPINTSAAVQLLPGQNYGTPLHVRQSGNYLS